MSRCIAIDGPSGAGKSSTARMIAKRLGLTYVDTGAMYRGMAIYFLSLGLSPEDGPGICAACHDADVSIEYRDGVQKIILNGQDVTQRLRDEAVGGMASAGSVFAPVREKMVQLQRNLAKRHDCIMDGRDIGTVVLPDAILKVYLTADIKERARRRYLELKEKGLNTDIETVEDELAARDARDMGRPIAPLRPADDAVVIDSTDMDAVEVADRIIGLYNERIQSFSNAAGRTFGISKLQ